MYNVYTPHLKGGVDQPSLLRLVLRYYNEH
jgi:hypothetical protein